MRTLGILLLLCTSCMCQWWGDIVFEDNFNGNSLNLSKWEYQDACDGRFGPNNLQCYTRRNVKVQDGFLKITAKQEKMGDKNYTSGRVRQLGAGFTYGAYVVRARMPRGDHLWPALWLLPPNNDCRYEEIDIAEYRGQAAEARRLDMAAHWGKRYDILTSKGQESTVPSDLSQDFHEYAVLWVPSKIEWFVDNRKYYSVSLTDGTFNSDPNKLPCRGGSQPFDHPTNFIFNIAVGGSFFPASRFPVFDPNSWTKPTLEIDWVRIYQSP